MRRSGILIAAQWNSHRGAAEFSSWRGTPLRDKNRPRRLLSGGRWWHRGHNGGRGTCVWIWPAWESLRKLRRASPAPPSSLPAQLRIPCPPRMPPINEDPTVFVATWRAASRSPDPATRSPQKRIVHPKNPASRSQTPHASYLTPCPYQLLTILVPTPYHRRCILGFRIEIRIYSGVDTRMVRRWCSPVVKMVEFLSVDYQEIVRIQEDLRAYALHGGCHFPLSVGGFQRSPR